MRKTLLALAAVLTVTSGSLSARELLCEQCLPEPECWEHLFVERCQWFVHGEFLYWGIAEGNMDYALVSVPGNVFPLLPSDYQVADFDFCPGFRIATSYYNCPKYWEVMAQYTWMHNEGKESVSPPESGGLFPTRLSLPASGLYSAANKVEFDYQLGDLHASRIFDPNPHLRIRLFGGVTLAHLKQNFDTTYQYLNILLSEVFTSEDQWSFFGGGFRLGVSGDWFWGCQFYLTGKVSFATLYGSYENKSRQTFINSEPFIDIKYDDPRFAFHTQFAMGPSWQIPCDCWSFELFAGYEMNLWFNLNEGIYLRENADGRTNYYQSVLGLHGLTLRLTLGF